MLPFRESEDKNKVQNNLVGIEDLLVMVLKHYRYYTH